jgi:putative inorganic carbon (hco3(-)) transporter
MPAEVSTLRRPTPPLRSGPALAFVLFIIVNAVLLIRPAEIVPDLEGIELYFYAIILCVLVAANDLLTYVTSTPLETQPITLCLLALCAIVALPHLFVMNLADAWSAAFLYLKNVVYFLLFVSIITTPARLRGFIGCLLVIAAIAVSVAVLDYHQLITLPNLRAVQDSELGAWGEVTTFERLQFSGLFKDPNDLCVWLAAMVPLALYCVLADRNLVCRAIGLCTLLLFGYGIYLTRSRGGFLAMATGLGMMAGMRYGRQQAALLVAIGLPLLLLLFAGRQTSFSAMQGTGQTRVQIWSDWMDRFRANPILGAGIDVGEIDPALAKDGRAVVAIKGHAAHNSYLQAFADTGFIGGCLFLGAFGTAIWSLWRLGQARTVAFDPPAQALQPFVLGATAAYGVGMLTLSLWLVAPTYVVLALAASYPRVYRSDPPVPPIRFEPRLLGRFALAGFAFLAGMYVFVRLFVNWG